MLAPRRFARLKKYKPFIKPKKIKPVALPTSAQAAETLVSGPGSEFANSRIAVISRDEKI